MTTTFNMAGRGQRRTPPKIGTMPLEDQVKNAERLERMHRAREHARTSEDDGMRKACELAEKCYGVEDVMGDYRWPRVTRSFAKLLVLGVP